MTDKKLLSAGNMAVRWALPGFAANWKKPTVVEVNNTLDVTKSVAWADFSFGNQASTQISDPSIADPGNVQTRGFAQFGGAISFFYPKTYGDPTNVHSNTFDALDEPRTLGYVLVRIDGDVTPDGNLAAINGDFWNIYKVISDGWSDVNTGEVNFKYTISFQPQGDLWVNAWVGTTPAVVSTLTGGPTLTVGGKKALITYITGRQVSSFGYAGAFSHVSSNPAIVTVDANGLAKGVAAGTATLVSTWNASGTSSTPLSVTVS